MLRTHEILQLFALRITILRAHSCSISCRNSIQSHFVCCLLLRQKIYIVYLCDIRISLCCALTKFYSYSHSGLPSFVLIAVRFPDVTASNHTSCVVCCYVRKSISHIFLQKTCNFACDVYTTIVQTIEKWLGGAVLWPIRINQNTEAG